MKQLGSIIAVVTLATSAVLAACGSSSDGPGSFGDASADGTTASGDGSTKDSSFSLNPDVGVPSGDAAHDTAPPVPVCDPSCVVAGGTCSAGVCTLTDNPGMVSATVQQQLGAGGLSDPTFAWLYPYDATVFPRGLISPSLQLAGTAADAVLIHISFKTLSYTGFFGPSTPIRAQLSDPMWKAVTQAAGPTDAVSVAVTKISAGKVSGPVTETWTIAQGNMRGQIYYETYGSPLLGGSNSVGIMSIAPGATAPTPLKSGCGNVCHTASADGSTLVANVALDTSSAAYDLKTGASVINTAQNLTYTYGALTGDGTLLMSATNYRTFTGGASALYTTATAAKVAAPGWDGVIKNSGTPAFAPDSKFIAFNHFDKDPSGKTLAVAAFDMPTKTFSAFVDVATGTSTLAWPAFTPDDKTVVYHQGSSAQFETDRNALGDLYGVDLATKTPVRLDALDGYTAAGSTYLPAKDVALNFAPTVLPEAVGGYFWVVFTSHRSYGNTLPTKDNNDQNGKLWVAALDLNGTAGKDASHPAFYLDGQEAAADNLRGFWVLPPCKANGNGCASGDECCQGFCRSGGDAGALVCSGVPATGCSNEYEKCTQTSDCCGASAGISCIGGFCAAPPPK
jgi:hypothetical protein